MATTVLARTTALAALAAGAILAGCGEPEQPPAAESRAEQAPQMPAQPAIFGFGTPADGATIAAWDIDVMPDGTGLPAGSGTVASGQRIYAAKCAVCHGQEGRGGPNDRLVSRPGEGFPSGDDPDSWSSRTIGSYWPYATTLFDYIRRSMPQNMPGSLADDEVYALTAYLLHLNRIVPKDAVIDAETLPAIRMPALGRFVPDDRLEYSEVH